MSTNRAKNKCTSTTFSRWAMEHSKSCSRRSRITHGTPDHRSPCTYRCINFSRFAGAHLYGGGRCERARYSDHSLSLSLLCLAIVGIFPFDAIGVFLSCPSSIVGFFLSCSMCSSLLPIVYSWVFPSCSLLDFSTPSWLSIYLYIGGCLLQDESVSVYK
jgi:hypothetical protein